MNEEDLQQNYTENALIEPEIEPQIEKPASVKSEIGAFIWEVAKVVIISLAIILPIRYYLAQPFFVKGASMEPSFEDGDYLIIDEISYRLSQPQRGDVIVFRYPYDPSQFFIKRIVGLPGETVRIKNNEVIIYNKQNPKGFILKEDYLSSSQKTLGDMEKKLDDNDYFVLGDNRLESSDSRIWGPVNKSFIIGRAVLRPWPVNRMAGVQHVSY